jgi:hypothetical protein
MEIQFCLPLYSISIYIKYIILYALEKKLKFRFF